MKIGIIGSGDVGRKLADGFIELGHHVKIGSRDPNQSKITDWINKHDKEKASSGTFAETASFGELIALATLWEGTADAIQLSNSKNLTNKLSLMLPIHLTFLRECHQPSL
jgi:8-hydroxy-5-deazaflavin:NADPH oxidoreductase